MEARRSRIARIGAILILFLTLVILAGFVRDYVRGGNAWKQGDWLINDAAGPIRRGALGSLLIRVGDVLGIGPLATVIALQLGLVVIFSGAILPYARSLCGRIEYWLLFFCPGFPLLFWGAQPMASGRKELVTFAAIALVAVAARPGLPAPAMLLAASAIYALGAIGHEVNALLLPVMLVAVVLVARHRRVGREWMVAALAICVVFAVFGGVVALLHPRITDSAAICAPLTARHLDPAICSRAMEWVSFGPAKAHSEMLRLLKIAGWGSVSLGIVIGLGTCLVTASPVIYLATLHQRPRRLLMMFAALGLLLVPLYFVAIDWGRWIDIQITTFGLLLFIMLSTGMTELARRGNRAVIAAFLILALVWTPDEKFGIHPGKIAETVILPPFTVTAYVLHKAGIGPWGACTGKVRRLGCSPFLGGGQ